MELFDHVVVPSNFPRTGSYAETAGDRAIIWLKGEHDSATVKELTMLLTRSIALTRSDVVVDMSGVAFMGLAPLDVIVRAGDFLERHSRALVLRAPSPSAQLIFELCGIVSLLEPARADGVVINGAVPALNSFVPVPATPSASAVEAPAPNSNADPKLQDRRESHTSP